MTTGDDFRATIRQSFRAHSQIISRFRRRGTANTTRTYAVQGLYLVAVRAFEAFLESQVALLSTTPAAWMPRTVGGINEVCQTRLLESRPQFIAEIISRGRGYVPYLPYKNTIEIAKFLFIDGKPFTLPDPNDRQILARCSKVRNYVAHNSVKARADFVEEASKVLPVVKASTKVIDYLDANIRAGVTNFENDLSVLARISNLLE